MRSVMYFYSTFLNKIKTWGYSSTSGYGRHEKLKYPAAAGVSPFLSKCPAPMWEESLALCTVSQPLESVTETRAPGCLCPPHRGRQSPTPEWVSPFQAEGSMSFMRRVGESGGLSLSHSNPPCPNPWASAPGSVYTSSPAPRFAWPLPALLLPRGHQHHTFLSPCVLEKPSQSLEMPPPLSSSKPPVTMLLVSQVNSSDWGVAAVDCVCVPPPLTDAYVEA